LAACSRLLGIADPYADALGPAADVDVDVVETGADAPVDGAAPLPTCISVGAQPAALANDPTNTAIVWASVDGVHRADLPGLDHARLLASDPADDVVVVSPSGSPRVYWTGTSGVYGCPLDGCTAPATLAGSHGATFLGYWATGDKLVYNAKLLTDAGAGFGVFDSCDPTACTSTIGQVWDAGTRSVTKMALGGGGIYWIANNLLASCPSPTNACLSATRPIGGVDGVVADVAVDDTNVYLVIRSTTGVGVYVCVAGNVLTASAKADLVGTPQLVAVDDRASLYVALSEAPTGGELRRCVKDTRTPCGGGGELIAGGQNDIIALSAGGRTVSWVDAQGDGTYRICAVPR
jgi:hypothetical protein